MEETKIKIIGSLPVPTAFSTFKMQQGVRANMKRLVRGFQEEIEFEKTQEALGGKNETNESK
ncbi:MAG: hypothetical protein FWE31_02270 [Firmicutes bacterium]|nr:hypothetical protein [Bacillota bacterium]